ncbi:hypothetical protein B0T16DRAFT_409939 [Cercophora newfieldiana]|uniref:Uncharacterized protein n=1 Tax=Cercophora newfieldiana TaxID=92897 RepID=A0AA40CUE4_9PEZI|nr:hypothetical protein B0T16DRAFT_409939 [Cercophora newfieldiana]
MERHETRRPSSPLNTILGTSSPNIHTSASILPSKRLVAEPVVRRNTRYQHQVTHSVDFTRQPLTNATPLPTPIPTLGQL